MDAYSARSLFTGALRALRRCAAEQRPERGRVVAAKDPRLIIDVDSLTVDGWAFDDVIPTERVTALLNEPQPGDLEALTPLRATLRVFRVGEGLRLDGKVSCHLNRPCGRCLQPAP